MRSPSTFLFRCCAVVGLGAVVAIGAAALPADPARPTIESVGAADAPAAPEVTVPGVDDAITAEQAVDHRADDVGDDRADDVGDEGSTGESTAVEGNSGADTDPAADPAAEHEGDPDHLTPVADDTAEPEPVVTTTVAPPPTTTAKPAEVAAVAFTASQRYGSCSEAVPYDVFSGDATPGSTISISSPYGSGSTVADADGHWVVTVEFPSAPRGETFSVAATGPGGSKTFSFTATGDAHA